MQRIFYNDNEKIIIDVSGKKTPASIKNSFGGNFSYIDIDESKEYVEFVDGSLVKKSYEEERIKAESESLSINNTKREKVKQSLNITDDTLDNIIYLVRNN